MNVDLLATYYPSLQELDRARVLQNRRALEQRFRDAGHDADTAPNSPFGDLFVTPAAEHITALEEAWRRFLNDLDPENAAKGEVTNCDFVRAFLNNFGLYNPDDHRSYGLLRLTFSSNVERNVDRSTLFRFSATSIYRPYLSYAGPLKVLPAGTTGNPGENWLPLVPFDDDTWVADILVEGDPGSVVSSGALAEVNSEVDGLTEATALSDYVSGFPSLKIQDLARRTRYNFHSRTPNTRTGVVSYLNQRAPEISSVGCLVSGDPEMARDLSNPMGLSAGKMDVLVRADAPVVDSVTVELPWIEVDGSGNRKFVGVLELPEIPVRVLSITTGGRAIAYDLVSVSKDPARFPGVSAAFGDQEMLVAEFNMPTDPDTEDPLVTLDTRVEDGVTRYYGRFQIRYEFDPYLRMASEFLKGDDLPVGLDTYVRYFNPVEITDLEVHFNRKSGVRLDLAGARLEILQFFNRHTFDNPALGAAVVDAMYYAGAHSVVDINLDAEVRFSAANKVYTGNSFAAPTGYATYAAFAAQVSNLPVKEVTSVYEPDFSLAPVAPTYAASGPRSVSWLLNGTSLHFIENRSV